MSRVLGVTFVILLCDILSFAILLPLLPSILAFYKSSDNGNGLFTGMLSWADWLRPYVPRLDHSDLDVVLMGGLLGSIGSLLQLHSSLFVGRLADQWGRRPLVLLCELGSVISLALWLIAGSFPLFVFSRIVSGVSRGLSQLSHTIAADISSPLQRNRAMAVLGAAFSLGFVFGPLLGAVLGPHRPLSPPLQSFAHTLASQTGNQFAFPAFVATCFSLVGSLAALAFLPETKDHVTSSSAVPATKQPMAIDPRDLKKAERLLRWVHFGFLTLFSGVEFNLSFFMTQRFAFTARDNGNLLAAVGIIATALQAAYLRRFTLPDDVKRVCGSGHVAFLISLILLAYATTAIWAVAGSLIFAYTSAVVVPTLTSLVTLTAEQDKKGASMGTFRAFGLAGRAIGPLLCSFLYWFFGATVAFSVLAGMLIVPMISLDKAAHFFVESEKTKAA